MNDTTSFIVETESVVADGSNPNRPSPRRGIADHECLISVESNPKDPSTQRVLADFTLLPMSKFATLSVADGNIYTLNASWSLVRDRLLDVLHEKIAFSSAYTEGNNPEYSDMTLVFIVANDAVPDALAVIAGHLDASNIDCGVVPL